MISKPLNRSLQKCRDNVESQLYSVIKSKTSRVQNNATDSHKTRKTFVLTDQWLFSTQVFKYCRISNGKPPWISVSYWYEKWNWIKLGVILQLSSSCLWDWDASTIRWRGYWYTIFKWDISEDCSCDGCKCATDTERGFLSYQPVQRWFINKWGLINFPDRWMYSGRDSG